MMSFFARMNSEGQYVESDKIIFLGGNVIALLSDL
jgi:hypothetical protein